MEEAARLEFTQNGYARTSLRAVASRAGVNPSVLYRHFASKEVLYGEVIFTPFVEGLEHLVGRWSARLDSSNGDRPQLALLLGGTYRYLLDHQHVLEHLIGGQDAVPPTMIERFRTVIDRLAEELEILGEAATTPRQRRSRAQIDTRLRADGQLSGNHSGPTPRQTAISQERPAGRSQAVRASKRPDRCHDVALAAGRPGRWAGGPVGRDDRGELLGPNASAALRMATGVIRRAAGMGAPVG